MEQNQTYNDMANNEPSENLRIPLPTESDLPHLKSQEELENEFLSKFELDPTIEDQPIEFGFNIGGIPCIPKGDLQGVKGLAKSAKTQFDIILMAAALRGEYMGIKCLIESPRILFCDSEQHSRNVRLVYRRVCLLSGIDGRNRHENLNMQHLRLAADVEEMKKAIFLKIKHFRPDVVFIDGIADLINDFNDVKESKALITELSKVALEFNCAIVNTLHTNPTENSKMRGHLGTILTQKASDIISCKKDKRADGTIVFQVEETENRNGADFPQFSFAIEVRQDLHGEYMAVPVRTYFSNQEQESLDHLFEWALKDSPLRKADLRDKICSDDSPMKCKRSMAYQRIADAIAAGLIVDDDPVTHRLRFVGFNRKDDDLPF